MNVHGSSINAKNFHQSCTETGSGNDEKPSDTPESSNTTIIIIVISIIINCFNVCIL